MAVGMPTAKFHTFHRQRQGGAKRVFPVANGWDGG